jgi:prepilin-type N-terminal cleavage/methylation domain-containing protein
MRKQAGFTLIELLVVILMIGLVAGALIYNFRSGDKQKRVNLARDAVITAFRTAQNYALAGKQIPPPAQATHVRGSSRCASNNAAVSYWVEFPASGSSFYLMAQDTCGAIMRVETYVLVQRTQFASGSPFALDTGSGSAAQTTLAVRFMPPFGAMSATATATPVASNFNAFVSGSVAVTFNDGSVSKTITVDGISGKIQ